MSTKPFRHRFRYGNQTKNHQLPTPISIPESMQNLLEIVVLQVKTLPDRPLEPQGKGPRRSPEPPQGDPGEPQGVPDSSPGATKVAQGSPKGRPKPPKGSQKHPQDGKIEAKTQPRSILKPMSVQNHIRSRFSIDFSSKSLPKPTCESMANFEEKFRRSCQRSTKRCCENHGFT